MFLVKLRSLRYRKNESGAVLRTVPPGNKNPSPSTRYGQSRGNPRGPGRPGSLPDSFYLRLGTIAGRKKVVDQIAGILEDKDHRHFPAMWDKVMDRLEGKPPQAVDLTSGGKPMVLGVDERIERLSALAATLKARKA